MTNRKVRGGVVIAAPPKQEKKGSKTKYKGIRHKDGEAIQDYSDDDKLDDGMSGVTVPRTRLWGGTPNSGRYGRVVQGTVITGDGEQGPTDMTNITGADDEELPEDVEELTEEHIMGNLERELSRKIEELPDVAPPKPEPEQKRKRKRSRSRQKAEVSPPPEKKPVVPEPSLNLVLEGKFGTYRGKASSVEVTDQFIAIVYPSVETTYTPPKGEDPIKLVCGGEQYIVFFVGCEFPLSDLNCFVQTYIRAPQDADQQIE